VESSREPAEIDAVIVLGSCAPERHQAAVILAAEQNRRLVELTSRASSADLGEQLHLALVDIIEAVDTSVGVPGSTKILIELPSTAHPADVIGLLTSPGAVVEGPLRLSSVMTVVDVGHLAIDIANDDYVALPGEAADGSTLWVANALLTVLQLECATELVVVNWSGSDSAELRVQLALLNHLNPIARLRLWRSGLRQATPRGQSIGSELRSAGWIRLLNGEHTPYVTDPRVSAFRYEQFRPFHPGRLSAVLEHDFESGRLGWLVRSAGFCRLASRPGRTAHWTQVGGMITFDPLDLFGADAPTNSLAHSADTAEFLAIGQDIAFIGIDLDHRAITAALDSCVLDDAEFAGEVSAWLGFADPFPGWPLSIRPR
jgi:G3E family GTPase